MKRKSIHKISFENVGLKFDQEEHVLSDVNFDCPMNEIVWLKGDSGSGKSLILKMMAGLVMPTKGYCYINEDKVNDMSFEEFLPYRCNIGYSFDFGGLISNRNIIGNLLLALEYHDLEIGTPDVFVDRVTKYMDIFNLKQVAHKRPSAIIGGLRKAACVARAFVHEPELILLDDPSTGLRGETRDKLKELLQIKRAEGSIKHIVIASDDKEFMKNLNPVVLDISELSSKKILESAA